MYLCIPKSISHVDSIRDAHGEPVGLVDRLEVQHECLSRRQSGNLKKSVPCRWSLAQIANVIEVAHISATSKK